ncbi:MAG: prolipoprotein diacylglyceryl transferase [Candidatus Omnitrophota bacterium]
MYPVLFKIGPISIYTYGVFVCLGVISGFFVSERYALKSAIDKQTFREVAFWVIVSSFAGARLFYCIIEFPAFLSDPFGLLLGRSGFVFYGGFICGFLSLYLLSRKFKISYSKLLDVFSLGLPLGHSLGRIGCFFYGCCYGRVTDSFFGVVFSPESPAGYLGRKIIPTQLISSFFLFMIFLTLFFLKRKKLFTGRLFLTYVFLYGSFRFVIEFFRADPRGTTGPLSTSQFIAVIAIFIGIFLWFDWRKKSLS